MEKPTAITKEQFKTRWESDVSGGGISFDDVARCAIAWGVTSQPYTQEIFKVRYQVLLAAGTIDAEEFNPANMEDEDEAARQRLAARRGRV